MKHKILFTLLTLLCLGASASGLRVSSLGASFLVMTAAQQQEQKTFIFPNPAKDKIYVKGPTAHRIELVNMIGEVVLHEQIAGGMVMLTDVQPGMYIVHVYDEEGTLILSTRLTRQ